MKKKIFSILSTMLAAVFCCTAMACTMTPGTPSDDDDDIGGGGGGTVVNTITYGYYSDSPTQYVTALQNIIAKWNSEMYGSTAKYDFKVQIRSQSSENAARALERKSTASDLCEVQDKYAQSLITGGIVEPITDGFETEGAPDFTKYTDTMMVRYTNGIDTATGKYTPYADDAEIYAIPAQTAPAMLFYNEALFAKANIKIISMTEDEAIDAGFGAYGYHVHDKLPDGHTGTVSTAEEINIDGKKSEKTGYRVFNNQVPMSIEELWALSSVLSSTYNPNMATGSSHDTIYGFNSEYWFPLGWTVGGDCLEYDGATHSLVFGLSNDNPNYLVTGATTVNGTSYAAGEILSYTDKEFVAVYVEDHGAAPANLYALPSTSEMFSTFVASSVDKGTKVAFNDTEATDAATYGMEQILGYGVAWKPEGADKYIPSFTSQESAMLIRGYSASKSFSDIANDYNVAPMPQYKEYNADGSIKKVNGTEIKGYKATWDDSCGLYIPKATDYKEEALIFMKWLQEDEQQQMLADAKFVVSPSVDVVNTDTYRNAFLAKYSSDYNVDAVLEAVSYSSAPDWCYTSDDGVWVNNWSNPLNNSVRKGDSTLYNLYYAAMPGSSKTVVDVTNEAVKATRNIQIVHHKTFQ